MRKTIKKTNRFDSMKLTLASPDDVLSWSEGEVQKPETINYRTQKPERHGLFCERIFGPEQDFQCSCGKYKGIQYQGITCDKCEVEITRSVVRRERMGHISLATPVTHVWYLRKTPSRIAQLLGLPAQALQKVVYYAAYLVISVDEAQRKVYEKQLKGEIDEKLKKAERKETQQMLQSTYRSQVKHLSSINEGSIIDEATYYILTKKFPQLFTAEKGAEVVYNAVKKLDLKKLEKSLEKHIETATVAQSDKLKKRLVLVRSFIQSGNQPEWMFLNHLPVIPPGIRPLVSLEGGRYASSDVNDLYRLVIIRNTRLKNFIQNKAPKIFIDTQKRLVQESVDALLDNSIRYNTANSFNRNQSRQLKSISEYLGGKQGYFRANLLGKRVDYSGRSVIVVGPSLKLDECGLPKEMALELFRPFIIAQILERELAHNIRGATRIIDDRNDVVWEILEKVIQNRYVLLNRQPTLHRQGIQAFKPTLVEGKAIELHPLVCEAYNADFDGDQMAVHVPLSEEAQMEAREFMISKKNIIKPGSGEINVSPTKHDVVLGCYWATAEEKTDSEHVPYFTSINEAVTAYDYGVVTIRTPIIILASEKAKYGSYAGKKMRTTVGRLLFNNKLPKDMPFINEQMTNSALKNLTKTIVKKYNLDEVTIYFDAIKQFGFRFATDSGTTFSWSDLLVPESAKDRIQYGFQETKKVHEQYNQGLLSSDERKRKNIEIWQQIKSEIDVLVKEAIPNDSPIGDMIFSGARGDVNTLSKLVGMLGIVDSAKGDPVEEAITSSIKGGLHPIQYFNFSYGARKGLSDTALKTADAGYLSRRLFDVAQEVVIEGLDCGTTRGFQLFRKTPSGVTLSFAQRVKGRFAATEIVGHKGVIVKKNQYIDHAEAKQIEDDETIEIVKLRSPVTCRFARGVCIKCYGDDKATDTLTDIGEPAGCIAAQSIGEPGTQLTMRTFHAGGVAAVGGDITAGLPRIQEIFDKQIPKAMAIVSHIDGTIGEVEKQPGDGNMLSIIPVDGKKTPLRDTTYFIPKNRYLIVSKGQDVKKGQFLTDGSADLDKLLIYTNKEFVQEYIFAEVNKVYELQGVDIAPVHFEVIIRQMFSRFIIKDPGDAPFTEGEIIEMSELLTINEKLENQGKNPIKAEPRVTGLVNVSTTRSNFLSAASFQNTTNVLIRSALNGASDTLDGLKENVILGRLVPIGSAFKGSKKYERMEILRAGIREKILENKAKEASLEKKQGMNE